MAHWSPLRIRSTAAAWSLLPRTTRRRLLVATIDGYPRWSSSRESPTEPSFSRQTSAVYADLLLSRDVGEGDMGLTRVSSSVGSSAEKDYSEEITGDGDSLSDVEHSPEVCVLTPSKEDIITASSVDLSKIAEDLATNLSIPLIAGDDTLECSSEGEQDAIPRQLFSYCLRILPYQCRGVDSYAIAIQPLGTQAGASNKRNARKKKGRSQAMKPFFIDFSPPSGTKMGKRLSGGGQKGGELLLRATAPGRSGRDNAETEGTKYDGAVVYDLTAGLGQDSCIIALGGASAVHMVERDPIVATMLEDALRRLSLIANLGNKSDEAVLKASELSRKLTLVLGDGVEVARRADLLAPDSGQASDRPDICYLDPMFPPRTKSAAVKKNMQILHGLLQSNKLPGKEDDDKDERIRQEGDLLAAALNAARTKVVVKRPIQAPPLGGESEKRKPSYCIRGSVNRWDVYAK